jgi:hypothetical protein
MTELWPTPDDIQEELNGYESLLHQALGKIEYWKDEAERVNHLANDLVNDLSLAKAFSVPCEYCGAEAREPCRIENRGRWERHTARIYWGDKK